MRKKILFIINPISGRKRRNFEQIIRDRIDTSIYEYSIERTERPMHAKNLAEEAAKSGADIVCAVGGDGSVHEAAAGLIGTETALAIIPAGSGNGLARHLRIPMDAESAIDLINDPKFEAIDTATANGKPFVAACGFGMDARVALGFSRSKRRGMWPYISIAIKELLRFKPIEATVSHSRKSMKFKALMLSVANSSEFGNGFKISPMSSAKDGDLEMVIVRPFRFWEAPAVAFRFFNGSIHRSRHVEIRKIKSAEIILEKGMSHYDGEPSHSEGRIRIEICPKSLIVVSGSEII